MIYPDISKDERAERGRWIEELAAKGVALEAVGRDLTLSAAVEQGRGVLCVVDDDPVGGGVSLGPSGFPGVDALRKGKTHCLIEGGVAPTHVFAIAAMLLLAGARMMWISTRVEHEADWIEWAKPHNESWAVLAILTRPEGTA
jgi:hypothetical protein